VTHIMHFCK
jgi:CspA family cold shock protein